MKVFLKLMITILSGLSVFIGIIFFLDPYIVGLVMDGFSKTAEYYNLIKFGVWAIILIVSFGLTVTLSFFISWLVGMILFIND